MTPLAEIRERVEKERMLDALAPLGVPTQAKDDRRILLDLVCQKDDAMRSVLKALTVPLTSETSGTLMHEIETALNIGHTPTGEEEKNGNSKE